MGIVANRTLNSLLLHPALPECIALDAVLVSGTVSPELRSLVCAPRSYGSPKFREYQTGLIADSPGILGAGRLPGVVTREANFHRPVNIEACRVDNILDQGRFGMGLARTMTTLTGDV